MGLTKKKLKVIPGQNRRTPSLKALGQDPLIRDFFRLVHEHKLREKAYQMLTERMRFMPAKPV